MLKQSRFVLPATLLLLTLGIQLSARTHASLMAGVFRFAGPAAASVAETDRDRDGLNGPVRRIKTEMVKLLPKGGQLVEGPRQLLETASYDMKGAKIDYAFFPTATDSLTGKEVYKYDDRGNIAEMTLLNADGSVLSKETYQYEFDRIGNWTKMTSLVAVVENGQMIFEPKEVTYRTITYYLEDSVAKTMQPAANQPAASAPAAASSPASAAAPKQQPSITPVKMEVATNNSGGTTAAPGTTAMRATDNATANPAPANSAANVPAPQQGVTNNGPAPANVAANNSAAPKQSTPANAPASAPVGVTVTAQAASPLTTMVSTSANLTMKAPEKKPEEVAANTNAPSNSNKGNSVT
ncbi:MAG: hypothetical protein ACRD9R_14215, partial [Pyrinomonadaceae bacterium]